jgi:hypothetical protein
MNGLCEEACHNSISVQRIPVNRAVGTNCISAGCVKNVESVISGMRLFLTCETVTKSITGTEYHDLGTKKGNVWTSLKQEDVSLARLVHIMLPTGRRDMSSPRLDNSRN